MTDIQESRWLKWTPGEGEQVTFRTGGSEDVRRQVAADELLLTFPADAMAVPSVQLSFKIDVDTFLDMQSRRWFNIPVGFTEKTGVAFAPDRPIDMVVATAPMERGGFPLNILFMGGDSSDEGRLATVMGPFLDPELERPVNNPLMYEVVRVSQTGDDGEGTGFDRAAIEAWSSGR